MEMCVCGLTSHIQLTSRLIHLVLIECISKKVELVGEVGGEGSPLSPVSFLSTSSLLELLLVAILLPVTTCRLRTAESPAQGEDCKQESSGQDRVVEEEGGVECDVVGAPAC